MKKLILLTATILLTCVASFAQVNQLSPEAEKKCMDLTRVMSIRLRLNESEYIKLKALNRSYIAKTDEIRLTYSQDERLKQDKIEEIKKDYEKRLVSFLSPSQLQAYASYKESQQIRFVATSEDK